MGTRWIESFHCSVPLQRREEETQDISGVLKRNAAIYIWRVFWEFHETYWGLFLIKLFFLPFRKNKQKSCLLYTYYIGYIEEFWRKMQLYILEGNLGSFLKHIGGYSRSNFSSLPARTKPNKKFAPKWVIGQVTKHQRPFFLPLSGWTHHTSLLSERLLHLFLHIGC